MNIRALLSAAALAALVACGGDTLESTPQATLVGRYAHNVGAGVSEIRGIPRRESIGLHHGGQHQYAGVLSALEPAQPEQ